MKSSVLEQQLPEETAKGNPPPPRSSRYADTLTLDACRCPHLQALLPHVLDLHCVRNPDTNMWKVSNPVHALHIASHTNPDGTTVSLDETDFPALYGEEQRRTNAIHLGGIADSFYPVNSPYEKNNGGQKEEPTAKALTKNLLPPSVPKSLVATTINNNVDVDAKPEVNAASAGTISGTIPVPQAPTLTPRTSSSSVAEAGDVAGKGSNVTKAALDSDTTNSGEKLAVPTPATSDPTPLSVPNITREAPQEKKTEATEKEVVSGVTSDDNKNVTNEKTMQNEPRAINTTEGTSTDSRPSSGEVETKENPDSVKSSVDNVTSQSTAANVAASGTQTGLSTTDNKSTGSDGMKTADESVSKAVPKADTVLSVAESNTTAKTETNKESEDKATNRNLETETKLSSQPSEPPMPFTPPAVEFLLPFSRYQQLRHIEDQILKQRRALATKRKFKVEPADKRKTSSTSAKKRKGGGTSKIGETGSTKSGNNSVARSSALSQLWLDSGANKGIFPDVNTEDKARWERDATQARCKVEEWMEVFRLNRLMYWDSKLQRRRPGKRAGDNGPTFGGVSVHPCVERQCDLSHEKTSWGFSNASSKTTCAIARDDELLQCLECSFVGCAPCSTFHASEQHIIQHFIKTGHNFAISCGSRAEVFCFGCGDFVYHELFDQEKERIDISKRIPWMGWKEHAVERSFNPMQFVTSPDHGVVWRGLIATYPSLVPKYYVVSARLSMKRLMLFRGELENRSLAWGPKALDFVSHQRLQTTARWKISAPIGLYNLGNTCFMSAVMQCLIHCVPLQRHFLGDVGHHYESCQLLRNAAKSSAMQKVPVTPGGGATPSDSKTGSTRNDVCLACEMDVLFLRYFGSTVGKNVIRSIREPMMLKSRASPYTTSQLNDGITEVKGEPLVTSDLLSAAWRSGGMDHLAGYEQRDAHEFLQAFLDIMGKHASQHRKRVRSIVGTGDTKETPRGSKKNDDDITKCLFEGTLRSVLICGECGCKRSLSEPFLNISLPLSKEMERSASTDGQAVSAIGTRLASSRLKISVQQCLEHFTAPEALADPVQCPSCQKKTLTNKQHTFAKLPRVLCLHLKRFDAGNNKKIDDFVSFPAFGLDMGPHLPHWCELMQGLDTDRQGETDALSSPQILYDLFGTVNHTGNLNQGHYVSNVKVNGQWYHCNDAFVCNTEDADVLKSDGAYVLFYIRR